MSISRFSDLSLHPSTSPGYTPFTLHDFDLSFDMYIVFNHELSCTFCDDDSILIKGDQASIIGGAVEFIKELQLLLQSLEAKKKRKSLSPSPSPSPRPLLQLTPSPPTTATTSSSPRDSSDGAGAGGVMELGACCNSPVADVQAKLSGSNVLLRTLSKRIPGQVVKIISLLERQAFEILHLNISSMDDTVLYSFVIKVIIQMIIYTSNSIRILDY